MRRERSLDPFALRCVDLLLGDFDGEDQSRTRFRRVGDDERNCVADPVGRICCRERIPVRIVDTLKFTAHAELVVVTIPVLPQPLASMKA